MQAQLHSPIMQQVQLFPRARFMTTCARKLACAEAIPKDAKREKAPQCKHKSKINKTRATRVCFHHFFLGNKEKNSFTFSSLVQTN